jgi:hypothetical protein
MAAVRPPVPALLVVAAFSRHADALAWARGRLEQAFGPVGLAGPLLVFDQTGYYQPTMGPDLRKQLLAFRDPIDPGRLAEIKLRTNALEAELAQAEVHAEERPLNLDPGYLVLGKFLLATTKDQAHRVYLRDGIFAEVTLQYRAGAFEPWPWTYADYRQAEVRTFLGQARDYYRARLREASNNALPAAVVGRDAPPPNAPDSDAL